MKKLGVAFLLSLFLVSSFVSAQEFLQDVADTASNFYTIIVAPFATFLLGANTLTGELFFAKVLFFIIIISVVWLVADKFPLMTGRRGVVFFVSLAVSILSVRFITEDWLKTILLPYNAFGIAFTSLIPFVLYFFFVKELPRRSMRKVAWIFAFVVFMGLFIYRNADKTAGQLGFVGGGFNPSYVYLITAILSLILLWFDGTIQRALAKARYEDLHELGQIDRRATLVEQYEKVQERYAANRITLADANKLIVSIRNKARAVGIGPEIFELLN